MTELPEGTLLRAGGLTLRVNKGCGPCTHIGEMLGIEDREAFRDSVRGRRGALCTVVEGDRVRVGDAIEIVLTPSAEANRR